MATLARFDLKLDKEDKDMFAEAATLMGTTMAGFVRAAAKEKAQKVIGSRSQTRPDPARFRCIQCGTESGFYS